VFLQNQKGETLTEIIVSMLVLVVIIMASSSIIVYSINASKASLDIISDTNAEIMSVVHNGGGAPGTAPILFDAELSFTIKDDYGFTVTAAKKYKIADKAPAFITKNGIISFDAGTSD